MVKVILSFLALLPLVANGLTIQDKEACQQVSETHVVPQVSLVGTTCRCNKLTGQIFDLKSIPENQRLAAYQEYVAQINNYVTINCSGQ